MSQRTLSVFMLGLTCVSCVAVTPEPFIGPNGNQAYTMKCSGLGRTLEECYRKAGEICPNGYQIVDQNSSIIAVPSGNSFIVAPKENLTIECK